MKFARCFAVAGVAAAMWLASCVQAPAQPAGARDVKTLSPQERANLLNQLKKNHAALVASRTHVKSVTLSNLNTFAGRDLSFKEVHPGIPRGPISLATPSPMPAILPLVKSSGAPYPSDYQQFCSSMSASLCLYYPAGVTWIGQDTAGNYLTIDLVITDPNVCSQTGGHIGAQPLLQNVPGCIYSYPSMQTIQFVPPAHGFTTSGWCDLGQGHFAKTIDEHGAVQIIDAGAHNQAFEEFCFIQVRPTQ
jgi:hypothetical protein